MIGRTDEHSSLPAFTGPKASYKRAVVRDHGRLSIDRRDTSLPERIRNVKAQARRTTVYTAEERARIFAADVGESERGRALIVGAMMENMLEVALRGHFKAASGVDERFLNPLFSAGQVPPLGNFAVKSGLARACGLIDEKTYDAMDLFRKMRNDAAHHDEAFAIDLSTVNAIEAKLGEDEHRYIKRLMEATENMQVEIPVFRCCLLPGFKSAFTSAGVGNWHQPP